ncbi:MAG: hypothetical protein HDQ97_17575 [Lachnospiraceae bacterium]|nr:hypothetical protein [Treponema sp.]MBD5414018.1 hypothetical protein [Treponema sp.]MBD5549168.1 hypothetical protein [Lachnospiraceae bacterium]MDE6244393.1 energy-coupled thiamine transporter ThiT [Treponemataceae bacterium]MDE7383682.1 energy-coupled thiamine transporter ThiT [Treponemataceae bacterium]
MTKINKISNASKNLHKKITITLWNNKWLWAVILMVVSLFLSAFRILDFPEGGSVTFMGLFVLWLYTFFYGWKKGFVFSMVFGVLRFVVAKYTGEFLLVGVPEKYKLFVIVLEFPIAYGVFSVGGFLPQKHNDETIFQIDENINSNTNQLVYGYLLGVFLQYVVYVITAIMFYDPKGRGFAENVWYCMRYDAFGLLFEAVLTYLVLLIPAVRKSVFYLKFIATHNAQ